MGSVTKGLEGGDTADTTKEGGAGGEKEEAQTACKTNKREEGRLEKVQRKDYGVREKGWRSAE